MEVHGIVPLAVSGCLVETHGIGEAHLEKIVITSRNAFSMAAVLAARRQDRSPKLPKCRRGRTRISNGHIAQ